MPEKLHPYSLRSLTIFYLILVTEKLVSSPLDQIANICWIMEKAREFQKNIYFCLIDYAKAFLWITVNCGKF